MIQPRLGGRPLNRFKVLKALYEHPASTRGELALYTSLSRPTVSLLADELIEQGILSQKEATGSRQGRPPVLHSLSPSAGFAVGLDIGHAHVRAAVSDLAGEILGHARVAADVDHAPQESFDLAYDLVRETMSQAGVDDARVIGIAAALAAPVDRRNGTIFAEGILPNWHGIKPAPELQARLGRSVEVHNDANLGALGEHTFGAGREVAEMLYVRLSAGIGSGLILGGSPYFGSTGIAGELGHVRARPEGLICRCGSRGCLETIASSTAVARVLAESRHMPCSVEDLLEMIEQSDRGALRAVADAGIAVGEALAAAVSLFNPQLVLVGGDLAAAGENLLTPLIAAIEHNVIALAASAVDVRLGALGDRAEVLGAVALVLDRAPAVLARLPVEGPVITDPSTRASVA